MKKHRVRKCESCNHRLHQAQKCMTCAQESVFKAKIGKVMHEFKEKKLHSRSKKGPVVTNPKQAIAIALSEGRKAAGVPQRTKISKKS